MADSRLAGFYRQSLGDRLRSLGDAGFLQPGDVERLLAGKPLLPADTADSMVENVIGVFGLPFAVAPNFVVNGHDYVVPMVVEEPSVVAAVSGAARLFRQSGGFDVTADDPLAIGQVQIVDVDDPDAAVGMLYAAEEDLIAAANALQPKLVARGGGVRGIEYYKYRLPDSRWTVVLHLLVDTRDAMGANLVNTLCEGLSSRIEALCGGRIVLRILSNLTDRAIVTATARVPAAALSRGRFRGEAVRDAIILANDFAATDPYRATTHNKGIMNGIDAVAIATGNDWRAIEAAAHAFAVKGGRYSALTEWTLGDGGDLTGRLTLPLKVGIVGTSTTANPGAQVGLRMLGVSSATELACVMAATGLAQNFAALRALVTDGIQKGHMRLHARRAPRDDAPSRSETSSGATSETGTWSSRPAPAGLKDAHEGVAAGKVILLGEHAAVYDRHVLALPIERAVTAWVVAQDSGVVRLTVPAWGVREEWAATEPASSGAAAIVSLVMQEMGFSRGGCLIHVNARIPVAMGLGSSAAFAVALIRAFDSLRGGGMRDTDVDRLAFECERITHGTPSGIDNNIATFGEPVLYTKGSRSRTKPIALAEPPPLVVASSGVRGITKDLVAGVRYRYDRNPQLYNTIFDEIDEISMAGAVALRECDYEQLGAMMNVCHGFLNAIGVSTPELEQMVDIARRHGAIGAKLTGAGGGGSIVALCPDKVTAVAAALGDRGYPIIRLSENQS